MAGCHSGQGGAASAALPGPAPPGSRATRAGHYIPKLLSPQAAKLGWAIHDETSAWSDKLRHYQEKAAGGGAATLILRGGVLGALGLIMAAMVHAAAPVDRADAAAVFQLDDDLRFESAAGAVAPPAVTGAIPEAAALWGRIGTVERRVRELLTAAQGMALVTDFFRLDCELADPEGVLARTYDTEAQRRAEDPSLALRGAYNYRDKKGGGGTAFFDEEGSDQDAYLELSWELLGNGERQREVESEIFQDRAAITRMLAEERRRERDALCRRHQLPALFRPLRGGLLRDKLALVEPLYAANRAAYFGGSRLLDDVLAVESEQAEVTVTRAALERLEAMAPSPLDWSRARPPAIALELETVAAALGEDTALVQTNLLQRQVAKRESRINDLNRLRLFLRAEAGDLQESTALDMVAGVRFTVPLDAPDEPLLRLRLQEIDERTRLAVWQRRLDLEEAMRAYEEQAVRAQRQEYRVLRTLERVRRSLASHRLYPQEADLYTALLRAVDLVDAALDAVAAREEVYRRVNEVLRQAGLGFEPRFVSVVRDKGPGYRARSGARSLYAWSGAFNAVSNTVIHELAAAKGVDELLVSAGRAVDGDKLRRLLATAGERGTRVSLVLAHNPWALPANHAAGVARAVETARLHPDVHLDVEPHTLPGFDAARERHLEDFVALVEKVRAALPAGTRLTVAVPVFWEAAWYRRLADLSDGLYLMAYEVPDPARIVRRIGPIIDAVGTGSLVVVLRTVDFPDEAALERAFDHIAAASGIRRFGVHKLAGYLELAEGGR